MEQLINSKRWKGVLLQLFASAIIFIDLCHYIQQGQCRTLTVVYYLAMMLSAFLLYEYFAHKTREYFRLVNIVMICGIALKLFSTIFEWITMDDFALPKYLIVIWLLPFVAALASGIFVLIFSNNVRIYRSKGILILDLNLIVWTALAVMIIGDCILWRSYEVGTLLGIGICITFFMIRKEVRSLKLC